MLRVLSALVGCASLAVGQIQYVGVAIAGGEFGCDINGFCDSAKAELPLQDGGAQMQHFADKDGMNIMRLPISWQFLANDQLGGDLHEDNLADYDNLVQSCLDTGSKCMIDIHNFGRWNGTVIGQGGPSNEEFAGLWRQLATKYADNENVVFQLMNAPHDLDIDRWAETCQQAVTAIREAGATSQMILLPGANWDNAAKIVSDGSADTLMAITNPDGSTDRLLLDMHKYLDADNSGTGSKCTTNNTEAFTSVAKYLRSKGRKGVVSETGATSDPTCYTKYCEQNELLNDNSDVFVGLVAWGAGSLTPGKALSVTPTMTDGGYADSNIMMQCLLGPWVSVAMNEVPTPSSSSSSASYFATSPSPSSFASATATTLITAPSPPSTPTTDVTTTSNTITSKATTATASPLIASHLNTNGDTTVINTAIASSSATAMTTLIIAPEPPKKDGPATSNSLDATNLIAPTPTATESSSGAAETTIPISGTSSSLPDSSARSTRATETPLLFAAGSLAVLLVLL